MEKYYKIAGLSVKMDTFGRTESQAIPYLMASCEKADIEIKADYECVKKKFPTLSDDGCEVLATGRDFYRKLLNHNGLMLHASALICEDQAYLFTANSGIGKSTHASNWRCILGDQKIRILNDDKPALRFEKDTWFAYGTPWCGKTGLNMNMQVPIAGIAVLERGEENKISSYSGRAAVLDLYRQLTPTEEPTQKIKVLELLDNLMRTVPIWKMSCNMDPKSAIVSYEAMSGKKYRGDWK